MGHTGSGGRVEIELRYAYHDARADEPAIIGSFSSPNKSSGTRG
jgi:hypothetical protein